MKWSGPAAFILFSFLKPPLTSSSEMVNGAEVGGVEGIGGREDEFSKCASKVFSLSGRSGSSSRIETGRFFAVFPAGFSRLLWK